MVRFLLVIALQLVISRSPVDPVLVTTGFRHRRDPTKLLYFGRIAVSIALCAEGRGETRRERGTGSRQRNEDLEIGMCVGSA